MQFGLVKEIDEHEKKIKGAYLSPWGNNRKIRKYINIISKQIIFSISNNTISTKLCAIYFLLRVLKLVEM